MVQVKKVDNHIKALENAEAEAEKKIQEAKNAADKRVDSAVAHMQNKLDGKEEELREAEKYASKLRQQIRGQETLIGKIPFELRDKIMNKNQTDRRKER